MPSNKEAVIQVIESCSEIGVAGLAQRLRLDKGTVRKVALEATREGRIGARNNGQGYVFFPATNQSGQRFLRGAEPSNSDQSEPVIDADFWELPTPHSDSRALVVHGAAQPADNRMAATLAAADKARRRQDGVPLPAGYAASLNGLFAGDQDEAWASLQQAAADRIRAASEHERWQREETARRLAGEAERKEREEKQRRDEEMHAAVRWALRLDKDEESPPRRRVNGRSLAHEEEPEPPIDRFTERRRQEVETRDVTRVDPIRALLKAKKTAPPEPPTKSNWGLPIVAAAIVGFVLIVWKVGG